MSPTDPSQTLLDRGEPGSRLKHDALGSKEKDKLALPCLSVRTGHEIESGGRKLVASAQRWRRNCFLQHGSILLALDRKLWSGLVGTSQPVPLNAVSLSELSEAPPSEAALIDAIIRGFGALFGEPPTADSLSQAEKRRVRELSERNRSSDWIDRTEAFW